MAPWRYRQLPEDTLLLEEVLTRTVNEAGVAACLVRLAMRASDPEKRLELLERAIERLTAFDTLHHILGGRAEIPVEMGGETARLCEALSCWRSGTALEMELQTEQYWGEGVAARRVLMIVKEIAGIGFLTVVNGGRACLSVQLSAQDAVLRLHLERHDAGGPAEIGDLLRELLELTRSTVSSDKHDALIRVTVPLSPAA